MSDIVEIEITSTAITARYGTLPAGTILRTDKAFATHLVDDCKAAKWPAAKSTSQVVEPQLARPAAPEPAADVPAPEAPAAEPAPAAPAAAEPLAAAKPPRKKKDD